MSDRPEEWMGAEPEEWSDELAEALFGAYVVVGLTYWRSDGDVDRQEQIHGEISELDPKRGVRLTLRGKHQGETFDLPPMLSTFQRAAPGTYRLRSTGEEVVDPDFTASWEINAPPSTGSN
jgi:hypothetical protein